MGGKRKNMSKAKRAQQTGRGTVAVGGAKARCGQVVTHKRPKTDGKTLQALVGDHVEPGAGPYTDEAKGYGRCRITSMSGWFTRQTRWPGSPAI